MTLKELAAQRIMRIAGVFAESPATCVHINGIGKMMPTQKPGRSKQDYETPEEFMRAVCSKLDILWFIRDLAASKENTKTRLFFTEKQNSLTQCWWDIQMHWQWLNPPYANIRPWVEKAAEAKERGANIAVLVPASVGANWWRDHVHGKAQVWFLNGRITFVGCKDPYKKDCALLIYSNIPQWRIDEDWPYHIWTWRKG